MSETPRRGKRDTTREIIEELQEEMAPQREDVKHPNQHRDRARGDADRSGRGD